MHFSSSIIMLSALSTLALGASSSSTTVLHSTSTTALASSSTTDASSSSASGSSSSSAAGSTSSSASDSAASGSTSSKHIVGKMSAKSNVVKRVKDHAPAGFLKQPSAGHVIKMKGTAKHTLNFEYHSIQSAYHVTTGVDVDLVPEGSGSHTPSGSATISLVKNYILLDPASPNNPDSILKEIDVSKYCGFFSKLKS